MRGGPSMNSTIKRTPRRSPNGSACRGPPTDVSPRMRANANATHPGAVATTNSTRQVSGRKRRVSGHSRDSMYDIATQGQIPGLKIRDWSHQDRAVDAVLDVYEKVPRATVLLPTGAGKTKVGAKLVKLKLPKDGNALLVVPNLDLVSQSLVEYIDELGLNFIKVMAAICSDESSYERARLDLKS